MPSKPALQREKRELSRTLKNVREDIAKLHADLERIEAGIENRRETRKGSSDKQRRRELHIAIQEKLDLYAEKQARLDHLSGRAAKLRRGIKRLARKIRNLAKPDVVKLDLSFRPMSPQGAIIGVTGHYTAGPTDGSDADAIALWKGYHQAHLNQGWAGLGYQVGFTRDGTIVLLRPFTSVGSHTLGNNTGRIGASVHGTTGDTWARTQRRAYKYWLKKGHTSRFPSSHRTPTAPKNLQRRVHLDFMATACPGSFESGYRNP